MRREVCLAVFGIMTIGAAGVYAQTSPSIGVRAGIGTDINGGIAFGVGGNYRLSFPKNSLELGKVVFGGSFEETTEEDGNTYEETTDVYVFAGMANYLVGRQKGMPSTFFIAGFGLACVSIEWEESSSGDTSRGTPLPGGGTKHSADGSAAGSVFNLGVGKSFAGGFDVRFELSTILVFGSLGDAGDVIPTAMLAAGYRF